MQHHEFRSNDQIVKQPDIPSKVQDM